MTALVPSFIAIDCAASAAFVVQRAYAVQASGPFACIIPGGLLMLGAGFFALARAVA